VIESLAGGSLGASKKVRLNFLSSVDIGERSNAHPVREIESISTTPMMLPFGE